MVVRLAYLEVQRNQQRLAAKQEWFLLHLNTNIATCAKVQQEQHPQMRRLQVATLPQLPITALLLHVSGGESHRTLQ